MAMAPLPHEYMIVGIIGFFISVFLIADPSWKFALALFFMLFIIASLISIGGAGYDKESLKIIGGKK